MDVKDVYINTTTHVPDEATEFDLELFERFMSGGPWVAHSEYMKLMTENAKLLRLLRALALCADDNADCDKCVMNGAVYFSVRQTFCNEMADELRAVGIEVD